MKLKYNGITWTPDSPLCPPVTFGTAYLLAGDVIEHEDLKYTIPEDGFYRVTSLFLLKPTSAPTGDEKS